MSAAANMLELSHVLDDGVLPDERTGPMPAYQDLFDRNLATLINEGTADRRRAQFLRLYGCNLVIRLLDSVAPFAVLNSRAYSRDGVVPVYIETPSTLPTIDDPWSVNVAPDVPIGIGMILEIAVVGRASIDHRVDTAGTLRPYTTFLLHVDNDGSPLYLNVPVRWTRSTASGNSGNPTRRSVELDENGCRSCFRRFWYR